MKRLVYQDRDECASHMVNIWRDAATFKYTHAQVCKALNRVRQSRQYRKLPRYAQEYVEGFQRSFEVNVIDRQFLEHGNWVLMPDGSEKWFGLNERINSNLVYAAGIDYKYMSEHSIADRTGIFWTEDQSKGIDKGTKPFFIPVNPALVAA